MNSTYPPVTILGWCPDKASTAGAVAFVVLECVLLVSTIWYYQGPQLIAEVTAERSNEVATGA